MRVGSVPVPTKAWNRSIVDIKTPLNAIHQSQNDVIQRRVFKNYVPVLVRENSTYNVQLLVVSEEQGWN